jgi:hypothetical protein
VFEKVTGTKKAGLAWSERAGAEVEVEVAVAVAVAVDATASSVEG